MAGQQFVLTVAESKRLIAKGIVAWPPLKKALASGIVAVAKGTTNGYVVEELTGEAVSKRKYVTGSTRPAKGGAEGAVSAELADLVLRDGARVEGITATEIVSEMKHGDVFVKGANAVNHQLGQAGVLIGHPTGGTVGAAFGTVTARKAHFLVPVGLEKSVPVDLDEASAAIREAGTGPALWVIHQGVFTEIEALQCLAAVKALPVAAGGIGGAEGCVRILVVGEKAEVDKVTKLVQSLRGEAAFLS